MGLGIRNALKHLATLDNQEQQVKGLLSLHIKLWHASTGRLLPLLRAAGTPNHLLELLPSAIAMCKQCSEFQAPKTRPTFKTTLSNHFNHYVQCDAFSLLGQEYLLLVDELFHYKQAELLEAQDFDAYSRAIMTCWIRFFGPPVALVSDQGGTFAGDEWAGMCDRFGITRILAGSDPEGQKHTKTGLVEKHIHLLKLTVLKLHSYMVETGLSIDEKALLVYESCMAHNCLLTVNGIVPQIGVLGNLPREYHDPFSNSIANYDGSNYDLTEYSTKVRLLAKTAALRAIVENRLAVADKAKTQKQQPGAISVGSFVDLYRVPKHKDLSGWRGPAVVLDCDLTSGTVTVKHQSRVYLVPVRHVRPHIVPIAAFSQALYLQSTPLQNFRDLYLITYVDRQPAGSYVINHFRHLLHPDELNCIPCFLQEHDIANNHAGEALAMLMDAVDQLIPGKPLLSGKVNTASGWKTLNENSHIMKLAKQLPFNFTFDGIRAGTQITVLSSLPEAREGFLLTWLRNNHAAYTFREVNPSRPIPFRTNLGAIWNETSFLLLYRYTTTLDENNKKKTNDDDDDPSAIDWIPEEDDSNFDDLFKAFDNDDLSMQPRDATMQTPSQSTISDEHMQPPFDDDNKPSSDDRRNQPRKTTTKQTIKTKTILKDKKPTTITNKQQNRSINNLPTVPEGDTIDIDDNPMSPLNQTTNKPKPTTTQYDRSRSMHRPGAASSSNQRPTSNNNQQPSDLSHDSRDPSSITGDLSQDDPSFSNTGEALPWAEDLDQTLPYEDNPEIPVQPPGEQHGPEPENNNNNDTTLSYWQDVLTNVQTNLTNTANQHQQLWWNVTQADVVVPGPWKTPTCFWFSITTGECYRVDETTDILTAHDLITHEQEVIAADRDEIHSFVKFRVFEVARRSKARFRPMSCVWVRRWKYKTINNIKTRVVKSRLCVRGFLDPQKTGLSKHSSTASRISQRLALSITVNNNFALESWDISSAFLQGFTFSTLSQCASQLGMDIRGLQREAYICFSDNVWCHLRTANMPNCPPVGSDLSQYCAQLLKPMYGLIDAPLLWQLCLRHFIVKFLHGRPSIYDDNFYSWRGNDDNNNNDNNQNTTKQQPIKQMTITAVLTAHVDDTLVCASQPVLDWLRKSLEDRFGEMKRQTLPFSHVGLTIERVPTGLFVHQTEFCKSLQPHKLTAERAKQPTERCTPAEVTALRSGLGGLMYLAQTRPEIAAELVTMMTIVNEATVNDIKQMNTLINRAKHHPNRGLQIMKVQSPFRLLVISDASHASSKTVYAKEGQITLLSSDESSSRLPQRPAILSGEQLHDLLCGPTQMLFYSSKKSARVSHSTSHAESLGSHGALATAELISARYTELYSPTIMTLDHMISHDQKHPHDIPIDLVGDAKDVLELVTGERGVPLDTAQRVIILSLRERRLLRKLRCMYTISTHDMIANRLTKYDPKDQSLETFLDTGSLCIRNQGFFRPAAARKQDFTEQDLINHKEEYVTISYICG
jgi:hypothetical protein